MGPADFSQVSGRGTPKGTRPSRLRVCSKAILVRRAENAGGAKRGASGKTQWFDHIAPKCYSYNGYTSRSRVNAGDSGD